MRAVFFGVLLGVGLMAAPAIAQSGSPAEGSWRTLNGTEIAITPCPTGFCGTLSWVVIPRAQSEQCRAMDKLSFASLMMDYKNPDKTLQTRPILGMPMMTLTPTNDPRAFRASVYNPEDGSTNNVSVWIIDHDRTLRLGGGCVGSMCVVTQDWPRAPVREGTPDFTCDGGQ